MTAPERIWAWPWEVNPNMGQWETVRAIVGDGTEYIRHDAAALAASPIVQAIVAEAVDAALDDVTTLHRVISDIRMATVGGKPMLSELAAALVAWRDEAVKAEREALTSSQLDDSPDAKSGSNVRKFYPKDAAKIADNVLEQAMGQYGSLLILGYDHEGQMDVRASLDLSDGGDILWLLEVFKSKLLNGDYSAGA